MHPSAFKGASGVSQLYVAVVALLTVSNGWTKQNHPLQQPDDAGASMVLRYAIAGACVGAGMCFATSLLTAAYSVTWPRIR